MKNASADLFKRLRDDFHERANPVPEDVLFAIEVADPDPRSSAAAPKQP